ncbi:MAG TPA: DEAD/DEAH box helicase family protein [Candidatus Nitrosocosmicus sp.]|nr:DEAD/DEAH box helicase family protein [Candidatus Nitrosocosmicus sp.]
MTNKNDNNNQPIELRYDKGTITISGNINTPYSVYDPRINKSRAFGRQYQNISRFLETNVQKYTDNVENYVKSPLQNNVSNEIVLRDYQSEALKRWFENDKMGCIILPTGAGKTIIAIKAIIETDSSTLIVVPTLNLMEQWFESIKRICKDKNLVGMFGGGYEDIKMITITTYDSAYLKSSFLGNKFKFIIFDEAHHLASEKYSSIGEHFISPYRLGLTATIEREDGRHIILFDLIGNIIYEKDFYELAERNYIANFKLEKRRINMLPNEITEYKNKINEYKKILKDARIFYPIRLEKLIILSSNNNDLRKALLLRNEALEISLNSKAKILELEKILRENNSGRKIIIFTIHTKLAYTISNRFLIPVITHRTKNEERNEILDGFKKGKYRIITTTKVLDEGTDIPDANTGIILSGTGSKREFVQRLGRLLRPKNNKDDVAELIEIISSDTSEISTSNRRNTGIRKSIK